jgi:hypothetical protein
MYDNIPIKQKKLYWIEGTSRRWDGYTYFQLSSASRARCWTGSRGPWRNEISFARQWTWMARKL